MSTPTPNWAGLPNEILSLIKSNLYGIDHCAFHAVCKSWYASPSPLIHISTILEDEANRYPQLTEHPLLVYLDDNDSLCKFYNPASNTTFTIDIPELAGARILFAKEGWLLMLREPRKLFFFNPMTRDKFDLPDPPNSYNFEHISVSSSPRYWCLIMGARFFEESKRVEVYWLWVSKVRWDSFIYDNDPQMFLPYFCSPIICDDLFFFLGREGNSVSFFHHYKSDRSSAAWKTYYGPVFQEPCDSFSRAYLMGNPETDFPPRNLMLVLEDYDRKSIKVFEEFNAFYGERPIWRKIKHLGDELMLFVSPMGSFALPCREEDRMVGLGNKVYFPRFTERNDGLFYSLEMDKFHSFAPGNHGLEDSGGATTKQCCAWIMLNFEKM